MLPIHKFIQDRMRELGICRRDVVRRADFVNLNKGHRRLSELMAGDIHAARGLIDRRPLALDVPAELVQEAIEETKRQQHEAEDAAYRAEFKPHAIILTEHHKPTSITMAAFAGSDLKLIVNFEPGSSRITYAKQAIRAAKQRSPILFFGNATGVIVNYSPDHAVRFDLDCNPMDVLPRAVRADRLTFSMRGRNILQPFRHLLGVE